MLHLKRSWPYYMVTLLAILGGMWLLRRKAISYYAHAHTLRLICVIGQWSHVSCTRAATAQIHHLEYLGGVFDTFAVIVGLLFGFVWAAALYIGTYTSPLYDNEPKPVPDSVGVMKKVLAANRQDAMVPCGVEVAGLDAAETEFATIVTKAMGAGFTQACTGKYLTT